MSFQFTVVPEHRVGLAVGLGHATGAEMARTCAGLVSDPRWEPGFDEVWDLTASVEVDISPADMEALVTKAHDYAGRIGANRCVFVYTRDAVGPVLSLFARLTNDLPRIYHTARTQAEALDWLGLPADALAAASGATTVEQERP